MQNGKHRILKVALIGFMALYLGRAVYEAIRLRWVSDDAFISFRYALHLLRGQGLVFNAGEFVEGFTNFLWTLAVFCGLALGLPAEQFSNAISITMYLLLLSGLAWAGFRTGRPAKAPQTGPVHGRRQDNEMQSVALLITTLLLAGIHHMHVFATSGLETMAFAACVWAGIYSLWVRNRQPAGLWLLTLACLLRPDGVIFLAFGYLSVASGILERRLSSDTLFRRILINVAGKPPEALPSKLPTLSERPKTMTEIGPGNEPHRRRTGPSRWRWLSGSTIALLAGPIIVLILYQSWRLYYYQSFFPNTFYAKSAYDPYPDQGVRYLALFYSSYFYLPVLMAIATLAFLRKRQLPHGLRPLLLTVVAWHGYIIFVGGDFMFARFLIPVLAPLCFFIGSGLSLGLRSILVRIDSRQPILTGSAFFTLVFLLALMPLLRIDPYKELRASKRAPDIHGIVEERLYYPREVLEELSSRARQYRDVVRGSGLRLAFHGGAAFIIYYMDPVYALEASTGLTDRKLARQVLSERGKIGHEKEASLDYMKERTVHIYMWPPEPSNEESAIRFQGFWEDWQIVTFDEGVFRMLLRHPGIARVRP